MNNITVIKQNIHEIETWRYMAKRIRRGDNYILLEARYNREDSIVLGINLKKNDRFKEVFFDDCWFNIFEIHDRDDDRLKGWYCDICKPAKISKHEVIYVDLSIDLFVFPDGKFEVLDEEEFISLDIDEDTRMQARKSLAYLRKNFFEILKSLPMDQG